jgi:hypothetical protein
MSKSPMYMIAIFCKKIITLTAQTNLPGHPPWPSPAASCAPADPSAAAALRFDHAGARRPGVDFTKKIQP